MEKPACGPVFFRLSIPAWVSTQNAGPKKTGQSAGSSLR